MTLCLALLCSEKKGQSKFFPLFFNLIFLPIHYVLLCICQQKKNLFPKIKELLLSFCSWLLVEKGKAFLLYLLRRNLSSGTFKNRMILTKGTQSGIFFCIFCLFEKFEFCGTKNSKMSLLLVLSVFSIPRFILKT